MKQEIQQKITEIQDRIFYIEMSDILTEKQKEIVKNLENEIKRLANSF